MNTKDLVARRRTSRIIFWLAAFGLWLLTFAVGKSIVDLIVLPHTIDLAAVDQLEAGFLPVYSEEDATADPNTVAVAGSTAQPFLTPPIEKVQPTADPGLAPDRILIPSINLDAPVIPIGAELVQFEGEIYQQWLAPDYRAAGWHNSSVGLGAPGNTVLNGHNNIRGEVFRDLYQLEAGDEIDLFSSGQEFQYTIVFTAILPERGQPIEVRLANAEWIQPTQDERITLVTCGPYESNTHRVLVVAIPLRVASD
ncbi:MAG TPA: sortase [Anaerolineales bacterium]|nr:sortase [Anaerolineales bacterium]